MSLDNDREAFWRGCGCLILLAAFGLVSLIMLRVFGRWYLGV